MNRFKGGGVAARNLAPLHPIYRPGIEVESDGFRNWMNVCSGGEPGP